MECMRMSGDLSRIDDGVQAGDTSSPTAGKAPECIGKGGEDGEAGAQDSCQANVLHIAMVKGASTRTMSVQTNDIC